MGALWIWRQFPRQIASDLHTRGQHIKCWLRGTRGADGDLILSSYELLYLLEFLPEDSAFKTQAERGGRWPVKVAALAEIANEAYRFRSSWQGSKLGADGMFDTAPIEFVDPVDRADRKRTEDAVDLADRQAQSAIDAELGYS
jgi:hypothetical protein